MLRKYYSNRSGVLDSASTASSPDIGSWGLITWRISARAENPSPDFANRARIFSPAKRARKTEKFSCNRNRISARAEKQETIWLPLGSRSDLVELRR